MKVSIHYYSGAGNTEFIARKMAESMRGNSNSVVVEKITETTVANGVDDDFDMLGVGFPIYFRAAPELVHDLLGGFQGKNRPIFFFCTKGMYSGNAVRDITELALDRGFRPVGSIELYMPGTDFLILFAKKGSTAERFLKRIHSRNIDEKINGFAASVQKTESMQKPRPKWYQVFDELVVKKLEKIYDDSHLDYIEQLHSNPDTCIQCLKCVSGCPRHNIVLDRRIRFGGNCDVCFKCIHNCPVDSIQIGSITQGNVRYGKVDLW